MTEEKIVTIASYSSISDAYIFKNILDLEGIENFVVDSNAPLIPSVPALHDGGVKLSVRESDAARALSVLAKAQEKQESQDR